MLWRILLHAYLNKDTIILGYTIIFGLLRLACRYTNSIHWYIDRESIVKVNKLLLVMSSGHGVCLTRC